MRDKSWLVYIHKNNINGKVYVGITHFVDNPNRRWINGNGYRHSSLIYKAFSKYGWDNFSHIVLCKTSKQTACLLEQTLISLYKARNLSYNIGLGGEGSESFSEETKNKLRAYTPWIKGKHHTQEVIEKIRQASRRPCTEETKKKIGESNRGSKNGMYGKALSEEAVHKIKNALSKPVLQIDKYGTIIAEFPSAIEAERRLGVKGNHIGCCCVGKRHSAYGYKWRYKYE